MTDSTTPDGAQRDTGVHSEVPLVAAHAPKEALALGKRKAQTAELGADEMQDTEDAGDQTPSA